MYEYLLALQLYRETPVKIGIQEAVQQALNGPKVVIASAPPMPNSIDQVLLAQNGRGRECTLAQINDILSKPYLNPRTEDIGNVVDDLMSRGKAIKYALNKFTGEELREMRDIFKTYLAELQSFELDSVSARFGNISQRLGLIGRNVENISQGLKLVERYLEYIINVLDVYKLRNVDELERLRKNLDQDMAEGKELAAKLVQDTTEIEKSGGKLTIEFEQRLFMEIDLNELANEIKGLMRVKGF
ncbi:hypothetical protein HYX04_00380 [Candidatus Woesearchaeota archaeon]|nr:hypothetical protein [Candidatus Woesearchaeota archaeon]